MTLPPPNVSGDHKTSYPAVVMAGVARVESTASARAQAVRLVNALMELGMWARRLSLACHEIGPTEYWANTKANYFSAARLAAIHLGLRKV